MTIKSHPKYPKKVEIDLNGPEGNAYALLGMARDWARQLNIDYEPILEDATSGDYDHLVETLDEHFGNYVDFYR